MSLSYEEVEDMEGKFLPENVRYMVDSMSNYARNRFRLETVSADTASSGRVITVSLPEGSCLDMSSFRFHFDAKTTSVGAGADEVFGKLPQDAQTLIQRVEVNLNGVAVGGQGGTEWNTVYQMKKLGESSIDRASSVDRALSHGEIDGADEIDDESLVVADWCGFLGAHERSTRFISTDLWGTFSVRITLAPNAVLVPKQKLVGLGEPFTGAGATNAEAISYSISNIFFTVDSVSLNEVYSKMLRSRLQEDTYLPLNYKEQYTFSLDNINTGSSTTRFSLSSGSIDKIYGVYRDSNYQSVGILPKQLEDASAGSGAFTANYLRFRSYDSSVKKAGTLRYNFSVNNTLMPQYSADKMDALADVNYLPNKVGMGAGGTLITSKASFHDGKFLCGQILNHPTQYGVGVKSGFNSRGINTMMTWSVKGQVLPPIDPTNTKIISAFVMLDCTSELRCGVGKSIAVIN